MSSGDGPENGEEVEKPALAKSAITNLVCECLAYFLKFQMKFETKFSLLIVFPIAYFQKLQRRPICRTKERLVIAHFQVLLWVLVCS